MNNKRVILNDQFHDEKKNKEFEILLVPGGMIVYRTSWIQTTPVHTATFVPFTDDRKELIKRWLYGYDEKDLMKE